MPQETAKPFSKEPPRSSDDPALVEHVLGSREADDMRALTGGQPPEQGETPGLVEELEISGSEKQAVDTELEFTPETRREQYIAWAEENIGMVEEWVDKVFEFDAAGMAIIHDQFWLGKDYLRNPLQDLPPGIIKCEAGLQLSEHGLTNCDNIPNEVEWNLELNSNPIKSLDGLSGKTIGWDLELRYIYATEIPADINVGGNVVINKSQVQLIEDARAKGYSVQIVGY